MVEEKRGEKQLSAMEKLWSLKGRFQFMTLGLNCYVT